MADRPEAGADETGDGTVPDVIPESPLDPPTAAPPTAAPPTAASRARRPRRRGRTALLISAAAVLGVLAGAGAGYEIQYLRPDTPLPPLAQPRPRQPTAPAAGAAPLTAAEDSLVTYDGDLRKLLIARPKGAHDWSIPAGEDGWMSLHDYATTFDDARWMFGELTRNDFRRLAVATWEAGSGSGYTDVEIRLVQFRDETNAYADDHFAGQKWYMPQRKFAGNRGKAIPGTLGGRAWVYSKPSAKPGLLPEYQARALARQGDIVIDIWITSAKPITGSTIMSLAKRQLERL